jgi:enoyl-CoA hydratase/carnithine racemase
MTFVSYEVQDRIASIRLNRPEKLNAINGKLLDELADALYRLDQDETADIGILSGEGRAFCSGADYKERVGTLDARGVTRAPRSTVLLSRFFNYKPIIAAVHGYAVGAGLILVLTSDLVVADSSALFQIAEVPRGLDGSSLWEYLRVRTSGAFADDMALTGRVCGAQEAFDRGLVNRLADEGHHLDVAAELARQVIRNPPLAVRTIVRSKRVGLEILETRVSAMCRERTLQNSADYRESVASMRENREPVYRGE